MKAEYKEGPDAREKFEKAMTAIFRAPKKKAAKPKKTSRKSDRGV